MLIDEIRQKISDKLSSAEVGVTWIEILEDTTPGHYGAEDIDFYIDYKNIWVDVPEREFKFNT